MVKITQPKDESMGLVDLNQLSIHPTLQRKLNPKHAAKLAKNWTADSVATIEVMEVNGTLWVTDGQHRIEAAKRLGIPSLVCRIKWNRTAQKMAQSFVDMNAGCKKSPAYSNVVNKATAGDKIAQYSLDLADKYSSRYDFDAWSGLERAFNRYNKTIKEMDDFLNLYIQVFGQGNTTITNKAFMGLFLFMERYGGGGDPKKAHHNFSKRRLINSINKVVKNPQDFKWFVWEPHDTSRGKGTQREYYVLDTIIKTYNKGRSVNDQLV